MFEFAGEWQKPIDYLFLAVTAFIAVNGVRYRDEEGKADFVRLLFACIAGAFFFMVLFQDVLGIARFA